MTKGPLVLLCLTVACIALSNNDSRAQSQDPHLPPPTVSPSLDKYVVVDDMLLTPEHYAELTAPSLIRRQAHPMGLGVRLNNWDWGVIPYEFAPGFSEAEVQNILLGMRGWESVAPIRFVPRTTQSGFLAVVPLGDSAPACTGSLGQTTGLGQLNRLSLSHACAQAQLSVNHELGHVIGFLHEHQRSDRDNYLAVDPSVFMIPLLAAPGKSSTIP